MLPSLLLLLGRALGRQDIYLRGQLRNLCVVVGMTVDRTVWYYGVSQSVLHGESSPLHPQVQGTVVWCEARCYMQVPHRLRVVSCGGELPLGAEPSVVSQMLALLLGVQATRAPSDVTQGVWRCG